MNSANSEAVAADDGIEPEVTLDQARATIPEEGANKMVWKIKNEVDMHEDPRDRGRPQMVTLRASPTPAIRARLKPTELRFNNRYTAITAYVSGNNPKGILPPIFLQPCDLTRTLSASCFWFHFDRLRKKRRYSVDSQPAKSGANITRM